MIPAWPCDIGTRRNLFLAIKEALHNILRHSQASTASLRIHCQRHEMVVVIRDDGRGFDTATGDGSGNGLPNMRRRVAEAGGTLHIESKPGVGTLLEFRIPMQAPARLWFPVFRGFPWTRGKQPAHSITRQK